MQITDPIGWATHDGGRSRRPLARNMVKTKRMTQFMPRQTVGCEFVKPAIMGVPLYDSGTGWISSPHDASRPSVPSKVVFVVPDVTSAARRSTVIHSQIRVGSVITGSAAYLRGVPGVHVGGHGGYSGVPSLRRVILMRRGLAPQQKPQNCRREDERQSQAQPQTNLCGSSEYGHNRAAGIHASHNNSRGDSQAANDTIVLFSRPYSGLNQRKSYIRSRFLAISVACSLVPACSFSRMRLT